MAKVKVGECYYREKDGSLWITESFQDADGVVTSEVRSIDQENDPDFGLAQIELSPRRGDSESTVP